MACQDDPTTALAKTVLLGVAIKVGSLLVVAALVVLAMALHLLPDNAHGGNMLASLLAALVALVTK